MLKGLVLFGFITLTYSATPIVIWHGMGDSCCSPISLGPFMDHLKFAIPGVYIKSIQIGSNMFEDVLHGFYMDSNQQVKEACEIIKNDTNLQNGYNAIGFSQGSQFLRAVAQICDTKMENLISFGGQHQGIYGLPKCFYPAKLCDYLRYLLNNFAYKSWVQGQFVQAQYWHDPLAEDEYIEGSHFLSQINNEKTINPDYIKGLTSLKNFVMVKFLQDTMVQPVDSEWFGFYTPGQSENITDLRNSKIYTEDRLGLRQMDQEGKLKFLDVEGDHLRFSLDWMDAYITRPYLS